MNSRVNRGGGGSVGLVWALVALVFSIVGLGVGVANTIHGAGRETIPMVWMEELHACQNEYGDRCYLEYSGHNWELVVAPYNYNREEGV